MQLCGSLSILWHCLSLGLEWKLAFSSPVATAEFSKFAGILNIKSHGIKSDFEFYIWNSNTLATSWEELTHWKRPWCWEGLGAGGEGDDRGWDGWMALPTRWTWVWVNSGSWWWTGRSGVLRFMGSQRVRHDWATELNWTEGPNKVFVKLFVKSLKRFKTVLSRTSQLH